MAEDAADAVATANATVAASTTAAATAAFVGSPRSRFEAKLASQDEQLR